MNHALAQQCLEALARLSENNQVEFSDIELIEALRAELAKPETEPYAWMFWKNNELLWPDKVEHKTPCKAAGYIPLYVAPTEPNCRFPTCHSQEYQEKLAEDIVKEQL